MQIFAERGGTYLLVPDGVTELKGETRGRILDPNRGILTDWQLAHAILKFGYWEPYEGPQDVLEEYLAEFDDVEDYPSDGDPEPTW